MKKILLWALLLFSSVGLTQKQIDKISLYQQIDTLRHYIQENQIGFANKKTAAIANMVLVINSTIP